MPFTLAHPAAILPIRHLAAQSTSLGALVIGSMAPDFVYFFPLGVGGYYSHSLPGLFRFCLPAGLLVYLAYYLLLRRPLVALLPDAVATRMHPRPEWMPRTLAALAILAGSLLLGAATHIAWDALTHRNTVVVAHLDVLRMPVRFPGGLALPLYKILQHASSVLGLFLLWRSVMQWMLRTPPRTGEWHPISAGKRTLVRSAILAAGLLGGATGAMSRPAWTLEHVAFNGVVAGMSWMVIAVLAYCLCWRIGTAVGKA